MKEKNILIIPDIHGRVFWKEAVSKTSFDKVVFLGDYLDPYYHDMILHDITKDTAVENFKEIIGYKKAHPKSTVLLLGNHDCTYLYGRSICYSRCDDFRYDDIRRLFKENKDQFQLAFDIVMRKRRYVFSHAGISIKWMDRNMAGWTSDNMVELLNDANAATLTSINPEETPFAAALAITGKYRGRSTDDYASPVWMDAELMHESAQLEGITQIVGHTQRISRWPVITLDAIYADCGGHAFVLNSYGSIRRVDGKRCVNGVPDPFDPYRGKNTSRSIEFDCFDRPYCLKCGSRDIHERGGTFVNAYRCNACGAKEYF
ncbi:MAG: metallophosphoesterase [Bacteroidales bacterium]|nr:metallophosphoesterase [Bacteroidales bacterium]